MISVNLERSTFPFVAESYDAGTVTASLTVTTQRVASIHANAIHISVSTTAAFAALQLLMYTHGQAISQTVTLLGPSAAGVYTFKHTGFIGATYAVALTADGVLDTDYKIWTAART